MRVFFSGGRIISSIEGKLKEQADELLSQGTEIIICDRESGDLAMQKYLAEMSYEKAQIVFSRDCSEYEEWPRKNEGQWPYREFVKRQHDFDFDPAILCEMADVVDQAIFVWDGKDVEQFAGMLIFLANGKHCDVFLTDDGVIREINNIDDLKPCIKREKHPYVPDEVMDKDELSIKEMLNYPLLPSDMTSDFFKEIRESDAVCTKEELKKRICNAAISLKEKEESFLDLSKADNLFAGLIRCVAKWKESGKKIRDLGSSFMSMIEHSFFHAYQDFAEINRWLKMADGSNENIILHLYEQFQDKNGKICETPIGMYSDINMALDYLKWTIWGSNGGRIELWERDHTGDPYISYVHKYNLYTRYAKICWFEKMRVSDLVDDCDPFEPVTYTPKNSHYKNVGEET